MRKKNHHESNTSRRRLKQCESDVCVTHDLNNIIFKCFFKLNFDFLALSG